MIQSHYNSNHCATKPYNSTYYKNNEQHRTGLNSKLISSTSLPAAWKITSLYPPHLQQDVYSHVLNLPRRKSNTFTNISNKILSICLPIDGLGRRYYTLTSTTVEFLKECNINWMFSINYWTWKHNSSKILFDPLQSFI